MLPNPNQIMGARLTRDKTLVYAYPVFHPGRERPDWAVNECDADYDDMALAMRAAHDSGVWVAVIDPDPPNPKKARIPKHQRKMFHEILSMTGINGIKIPEEAWLQSIIGVNGRGVPRGREERVAGTKAAATAFIREQSGNPTIPPITDEREAAVVCMSIFGQGLAAAQFRQLQEKTG